MIEFKEESKFCDCDTQTDLTQSDMVNFNTYKDWYLNDCWTAFANFAKYRKDILKTVKDEYITKSTMKRTKQANQKLTESKKRTHSDKDAKSSSAGCNKRVKLNETSESIAVG